MKRRVQVRAAAAVPAAGFAVLALAQDLPAPLFADGLAWKAGTSCTYDISHNGKKARWVFTIGEATGDRRTGTWSRDVNGAMLSVPMLSIDNGLKRTNDLSFVHGTPMKMEPGYQALAFPLQPGGAWEGRAVVSGTQATSEPWKVELHYKVKVGAWEKLATAAGESPALPVVSDERYASPGGSLLGTGRSTKWIGPGDCTLKKEEYRNTFNETASAVLVSEGPR